MRKIIKQHDTIKIRPRNQGLKTTNEILTSETVFPFSHFSTLRQWYS